MPQRKIQSGKHITMNFLFKITLSLLFGWASISLKAAPGDLESGFNPAPNTDVYSVAIQPDGKILLVGIFTRIGSVIRNNIARLNADGSLDTSFDPNVNGQIRSVVVFPDGKIVIGGQFTSVGGVPRTRIAKLQATGAVDLTFNADVSDTINAMTVQSDGKLLIGGFFTVVNTTARNYAARLHTDGTLDASFDPSPNDMVRCLLILPNSDILITGAFTSVGALARNRCALMNSNGQVDPMFAPNFNNAVWCAALQSDGKVVVGGDFSTVNGITHSRVARLDTSGTVDSAFTPSANSSVRCLIIQADGKIIPASFFTAINGVTRNRVARLYSDGSLDMGFDPDADAYIQGAALQKNGDVIIGGGFSSIKGAAQVYAARLDNDAATETLSVPSLNRIVWLRGGGAPEAQSVSFELSINGGITWSFLGSGLRITGGWELPGLMLPVSGRIRARAIVTGGLFNGSSGIVEAETAISPELVIEHPAGTRLIEGQTKMFSGAAIGGTSNISFKIMNAGVGSLTDLTLNKTGTNTGDFTVGTPTSSIILPGSSADLTVTFTPTNGNTGLRSATLHIGSNDPIQNPFSIVLEAQAFSTTQDSDSDGMNDWGEYNLAPLGFNWQVNNAALVSTLTSKGSTAGFFTASQVQDLNVGIPLLQRNPANGEFTLTLGVEKSTALPSFQPFPMSVPQTLINGQGKLEFRFTVPEDTAFFRLKAE